MIHHPGSDVRVGHVHPPPPGIHRTPSFNQARFLEATLRSVLEQDYPRLETIMREGSWTMRRPSALLVLISMSVLFGAGLAVPLQYNTWRHHRISRRRAE